MRSKIPLWDSLLINIHLACMTDSCNSYGSIENGAIGVTDGRIVWIGQQSDLPLAPADCAATIYDGQDHWLTPGLIDCHTHLVFGGNRAHEFAQRLDGVSYQDIAAAGGGIRATVAATRAASDQELIDSASARLTDLLNEGVTTVEIKSGYGLNTHHELRMLTVARSLATMHPVSISTTFLGAHALPEEYQGRQQDYIDLVCDEMLPAIAQRKLADAVDVFCETIGFTSAQTRQVFMAAKTLGLPVKLHSDQLSDTGGSLLAAEFKALSADHIEYSSEASIKAMANNNVVAVLLPGAFYYLRETQIPPIDLLRTHGVPIAIATDANPGSSPTTSLLLMMNMACTLFRLRPLEVFAGVTINAAKALGLEDDRGSLELGKRADFALWDIKDMAELSYWIGTNRCSGRFKDGQPTMGDYGTAK
jgi:imidazolonepropionase